MFGYYDKIKVEDVIKDQNKLLSEQIDNVEKLIDENNKELENLIANFESLLEDWA